METTSFSLLEQLRRSPDEASWARFVHLYSPLLFGWARQAGLDEGDAGDLVQDVLVILLKELPRFEHDPAHSFRAWLKTVVLNRWRNQIKRQARAPVHPGDAFLADVPAPDDLPRPREEVPSDLTRRLLALRLCSNPSSDPSPMLWALNPPQAPDEIGRLAQYRVLKVLGVGGITALQKALPKCKIRSGLAAK